ncbi:MAG: sporulation protein YunB [Clostridia bacterium]|nr:sporulation protein YunB [Clostridia bacterium]
MARFYEAKRRARRRADTMRRTIVFAACVSLAFLLIFNFQLYPGIAALAYSAATNRAQEIIAAAFSEAIAENEALYEELVTIVYRTDGAVASLSCHMQRLNAARNELLLSVLAAFRESDHITVAIPLGNLFGGELFSGRGPRVYIRVLLAEGASAHMDSQFTAQGINQTLHRVLFSITVNLTVLTPTRPVEAVVTQSYAVSETVIVGEVPDAYTQISRLTDDVTEEDIDDVNDFGAHL